MKLSDSINEIPGIGIYYARKLEKLNISTISDFLYHPPSRYIDYSLVSTIDKVQEGETVTLKGEIIKIKNNYIRGRRLTIQKATLKDETGLINITWFNQPYLAKQLLQQNINVSGIVTRFGKLLTLESPDHEIVYGSESLHTGRLVAVYPETEGLSSRWIRKKMDYVLNNIEKIQDHLPDHIQRDLHFLNLNSALQKLHQPQNLKDSVDSRRRLAFDELFENQLVATLRKREWNLKKVSYKIDINKYKTEISEFIKNLPFKLTGSQKRSVEEILTDLGKETPMNRLLQGDVGSGKTVVCAVAIYSCFLNGFNSIFMAPTEILANQHYKTLSELLTPYGLKISLITGSTKEKNNKSNLIIGTHALLFNKEPLEKIALTVIDEQHRFGVEQRSLLRKQNSYTHLLSTTATPIPRTIALTLYGNLDISIIDQMPIGRKIVKTFVVSKEKYLKAFEWIRTKIKKGKEQGVVEQAFIIYPLIEESEILKEVKAATTEFIRLKNEAFPDLNIGLLHGKLPAKEKNEVMTQFRKGLFDILVATSVVEVGMDIPNATIIVIEGAERFGLAALHQLRGRVGRSDRQSYCLLFSEKATTRLRAMEANHLGIKLAEIDLKIRGAGELYGIKQHGAIDFKFAQFSDIVLIEETRQEAIKLIEKDPTLKMYPLLLEKIKPKLSQKVAPD